MAEGSETPNGEGTGPEGRPRRGEGDLLAERRARRAAESGEVALTRRAEAAEATVQTLERHVASLQQRLREAEEERVRIAELIEIERAAALEREHELRRVKQREYAEQQLRVEAEERTLALDRESRMEIERLGARLGASEHDARELTRRLEAVQHQLAEGEHAAAADLAEVRADLRSIAGQDVQPRLVELERRAQEIERGLDSERAARAESERLLEGMREGHRRMESLLGEMKAIVGRVTAELAAESARAGEPPADPALAHEAPGADMADALAAAVERLRARAEAAPAPPEHAAEGTREGDEEAVGGSGEPAAGAVEQRDAPAASPPAHKHSMSWFARRRIRRKQRRTR